MWPMWEPGAEEGARLYQASRLADEVDDGWKIREAITDDQANSCPYHVTAIEGC